MKQGMMFFYIGIMMAVVQGGYVRRLPAGSEKKTAIRVSDCWYSNYLHTV